MLNRTQPPSKQNGIIREAYFAGLDELHKINILIVQVFQQPQKKLYLF